MTSARSSPTASAPPNPQPKYTIPPPKLAAFLVGDAVEFVPKPWPREKFKEAILDTILEFGDTWVICESKEPAHTYQNSPGWLAVTNMAMEARKEYIEMQNSKLRRDPGEESKECELEDAVSDKWEKAKKEDDKDTFCLIGIESAKKAVVLSNQRELPQGFETILVEENEDKMLSLEKQLSEEMIAPLKLNKNIGKEFKMKLPTVVMVIEGDLDTIDHVAKAVEKNIPVLLVRGSGMAADLIGYCLDDSEQNVLKTRAPLLFGTSFSVQNFRKLEKDIKTIQEHRSNVSEFNILTESVTCLKEKVTESVIRTWALTHVEGGKKAAVLSDTSPDAYKVDSNNGLLKGVDVPPPATYTNGSLNHFHSKITPISDRAVRPKSSRPGHSQDAYLPHSSTHDIQKHTSVSYANNGNRKEKASPLAIYMLYQLLESNQTLVTEEGQSGQNLLRYALQENLPDIAEVLVDKGVQLTWPKGKRDINTEGEDKPDGKSLYEEIWRERHEQDNDQTKTCIADIIEFPRDKFPKKKIDIWEIGCNIISYEIDKKKDKPPKEEKRIMMPNDLLLWAVLTNNVKMAELFWKRSHEPILTALVASAILRKMSRKAHALKEEAMEEEMLNHSRLFRQRAIDVTQQFYESNQQEAIFLLEHENKTSVWGVRESALEFSQAHKIHPFVAHHVPQRSFHRIWYGGDFFHKENLYKSKKWHTLCCNLRYYNKMALFTAPYAKFIIHYLFFSLFLVCLSAFVMTNIRPEKWPIDEKSIYEYCAYLWLFADIVEEYVPPAIYTIGQHIHRLRWKRRAWNHMHNFWNGMDALSYIMLICGICFRFGYETTSFDISRRFYSLGLFLMYMRFLHVLLIWRKIGPTVIMLKEGLKELLRFVIIMAVFVLSVGVFYHTNLYPNHYDMFSTFGMQYWSVWKIIYLPYWSIYGEFKDEIGGEDSTGNCSFIEAEYMHDPDIVRCPQRDWMVALMSGFFVLILNLLLVNLIIAMFSFRFEEIKENSDQFWRFHRSQVIMEFRTRIPVPFNLLWRLVKVALFFYYRKKEKKQNKEDVEARAKLDTKQQILARRWMPPESIDGKQDTDHLGKK